MIYETGETVEIKRESRKLKYRNWENETKGQRKRNLENKGGKMKEDNRENAIVKQKNSTQKVEKGNSEGMK